MEDTYEITLDPMITISSIDTVYQACKLALESTSPHILVHAHQVERLNTPVFQLLISLKQTLKKQQRTCDIIQPSEAFNNMLEYLGLNQYLMAKED